MRGAVGDDSRFVRRELGLVWLGRAEHEAQGDQCANQTENYQDVDQKWDVALEQVSEAASGVGAFRSATNSKRTGGSTCPGGPQAFFRLCSIRTPWLSVAWIGQYRLQAMSIAESTCWS